ncbi:MAG: DUF3169 family protein [Lachnospiraceae bacterium]|nr:DUF3169 family protein [Lachnospiraceae bacterium]
MDNEKSNLETVNEEMLTEDNSKSEESIKDEIAERKEEIRKEDNKKIGLFAVILVISGFMGGILGAIGIRLVISMEESGMTFVEFWNQLQRDFAVPASFLLIILDIIFIIISSSYLFKAKKLWKSDMDEDEKYEVVDKKLSLSVVISNVSYFVNFAFFGFAFYTGLSFVEGVSESWLQIYMRMIDLVVFMATLFINLAIQRACVNLTKLMNPEKKGSVYDMKFDKVWYQSCDEAERMQIGLASYKAFQAVNNTLIALMVIFVLGAMFFEIGILPIVVITVVALVNNITYGVTSMKLGSNTCGSKIS